MVRSTMSAYIDPVWFDVADVEKVGVREEKETFFRCQPFLPVNFFVQCRKCQALPPILFVVPPTG